MRKKILFILFLIFLAAGLALTCLKFYGRNSGSELSHVSNILFNNNIIRLDCVGFSKEEVSVTWRSEEHEKSIIQSGKQIAEIDNDYGPNNFDVKINGKKIAHPGNWKTANWHAHDYSIYVEKEQGGYHVKFCADGPDYEKNNEHVDANGQLTGPYSSWFANGKLSVKGAYKNGQQEGEFNYYFEDGKMRVKEYFKNGKLDGHCIDYRPDGTIESDRIYSNGL